MLPLAGRGYDKQGGYIKPHIDGKPERYGLSSVLIKTLTSFWGHDGGRDPDLTRTIY